MKLLGLDIATTSGTCIYESGGRGVPASLECHLFHCPGENIIVQSAKLGRCVWDLITDHEDIAYAAIEKPLEFMSNRSAKVKTDLAGEVEATAGTSAAAMNIPKVLAGAAAGVVGAWGVPLVGVASGSWRKSFLGFGRAPNHIPKAGRKKWLKYEAYKRAEVIGREFGVTIPKSYDYDAADALGIAFWLRANVDRLIAEDELRAKAA